MPEDHGEVSSVAAARFIFKLLAVEVGLSRGSEVRLFTTSQPVELHFVFRPASFLDHLRKRSFFAIARLVSFSSIADFFCSLGGL